MGDIRDLQAAARHAFGYFPLPDHRGFAKSIWQKRMKKFIAAGLATGPNAHNDFEITNAGRVAAVKGN